jgi:hypothetical protein
MNPEDEETPISACLEQLYGLADEWRKIAIDAKNTHAQDAYFKAARKLRRHTDWLKDKIAEREEAERHADTKAIWDSFVAAGWITQYDIMPNGRINFSHVVNTETHKKARSFMVALGFSPRPKRDVKISVLEKNLTELSEAIERKARNDPPIGGPPEA